MYIYVYIDIDTYIYLYTHVYIHIYTHTYIYIHIYTHTHIYMYMYTPYLSIHLCIYIHMKHTYINKTSLTKKVREAASASRSTPRVSPALNVTP